MIDLLRAEYDLFGSDGIEAEQVKDLYSKISDAKDKDMRGEETIMTQQKRNKRYGGRRQGGRDGDGAPGKVLIPLLPTDERHSIWRELYSRSNTRYNRNTQRPISRLVS